MKKIDQLLAIDKFEKARTNTRSLVSRCLDSLKEKQRIIQNLESDESLKKIDLMKREFMEFREREVRFRKQLDDVSRKKERMEKDINNLKAQQKRLQEIEENKRKFTALLDVTEKDIEKLKDEHSFILTKENTVSLIKNSELVITINSTVGLETLALNKSLLVLGRALYAGFDQEKLKKYIHHYLVDEIDFFDGCKIQPSKVDELLSYAN